MEQSISFSTVLAASVHDMKNAIGMVVQLSEELSSQRGGDDPLCQQLALESTRLNNDLVQLMALYKLEDKQYALQLDDHYLDEFVEDLILTNGPVLAAKGIDVSQQVTGDLAWAFDAPLVLSALNNVLGNLVDGQGAKDRLPATQVRVSAAEDHGTLIIRIEDNGPGFPATMLGELNGAAMGVDFVRGRTGFGLYFAYQVALAHGQGEHRGRVLLGCSDVLGGACFELYLP